MFINKEKIINVYDTFLARFRFFREFVKLLFDIEADIHLIEENYAEQNKRVLDLEVELIRVQNRLAELEDKQGTVETPAITNYRTSHAILEKFQDAYTSSEK